MDPKIQSIARMRRSTARSRVFAAVAKCRPVTDEPWTYSTTSRASLWKGRRRLRRGSLLVSDLEVLPQPSADFLNARPAKSGIFDRARFGVDCEHGIPRVRLRPGFIRDGAVFGNRGKYP